MSIDVSGNAERIAAALADRAEKCRKLAASRAWAGISNKYRRADLREEARRCDVLRERILNLDPVEFDAVVEQR